MTTYHNTQDVTPLRIVNHEDQEMLASARSQHIKSAQGIERFWNHAAEEYQTEDEMWHWSGCWDM